MKRLCFVVLFVFIIVGAVFCEDQLLSFSGLGVHTTFNSNLPHDSCRVDRVSVEAYSKCSRGLYDSKYMGSSCVLISYEIYDSCTRTTIMSSYGVSHATLSNTKTTDASGNAVGNFLADESRGYLQDVSLSIKNITMKKYFDFGSEYKEDSFVANVDMHLASADSTMFNGNSKIMYNQANHITMKYIKGSIRAMKAVGHFRVANVERNIIVETSTTAEAYDAVEGNIDYVVF